LSFEVDHRERQMIIAARGIMRAMRPIVAIVLAMLCAALGPQTRPGSAGEGTGEALLRVRVIDARNKSGAMIFGVFDQPKGFPSEEKRSVNWQTKRADAGELVFECRLPPGKYAASVLHDENGNGDMDRNLIGVPKEGYGVTNNPKPARRAARFDEALFDLPAKGREITISLQYF
jgi:uncharacterized protein (DUF2141 family)